MTDDPVAISDLADQAMKAADKEGIRMSEIAQRVRGHRGSDGARRRVAG